MNLSKVLRNKILEKLLETSFSDQFAEISARKMAIMDEIYNDKYGPYLDQMRKLPDDMFKSVDRININSNGFSPRYYDSGWVFSSERLVAHSTHFSDCVFDEDSYFDKKIKSLLRDEEALITRSNAAKTYAEGLLHSVRTVEKLISVWPEIEPFTVGIVEPIVNLPMVQISAVNELLGLPR